MICYKIEREKEKGGRNIERRRKGRKEVEIEVEGFLERVISKCRNYFVFIDKSCIYLFKKNGFY